jgi:exodeoxyribonuclease-3
MKLASFNINSIRARLEIVLDWLKKESPDVLCLQETKIADKDFPKKKFEAIQYHSVFHGEKSYNGVAILSKFPLDNVKIGFDEYESEGTRIISATVKKIPIVNTYVPQGLNPLSDEFRDKLDWLQRLHYYFNEKFRPKEPLVWAGDFNVAPEPIDVYNPGFLLGQVGYYPDEHAYLLRIKEWGFVDVFRIHHSEPEQYTFWDYRIKNAVQRKMGWRIDHIWTTKTLAKKCSRAWIDVAPRLSKKPSDHTIIAAEFPE